MKFQRHEIHVILACVLCGDQVSNKSRDRAVDVAEPVEYPLSMHKAQGSIPQHLINWVVHTYNSSTGEVEAEVEEVVLSCTESLRTAWVI